MPETSVKKPEAVVPQHTSTFLRESIIQTQYPHNKQESVSLITKYLLENVEQFRQLAELRKEGWKNPKGDTYFKNQRQAADTADRNMARFFYKMMKEIGEEMHQSTHALAIPPNSVSPAILDMCMAPGGFLAIAMEKNPEASALGMSLPASTGGHKVLLQKGPNVTVEYLDITMLAADMGATDIPIEHPDASNMLSRRFIPGEVFDIVLCDGQVLRTHDRAAYREKREARRLTITQLAIGLEHVKSGGCMIVLLHKVEAVDTVSLLYTFNKFSSVRLFKSKKYHAKRSSFYMIATNIQSEHGEAVLAVEQWKRQWSVATLGNDSDCEEEFATARSDVENILDEFGSVLIQLGREIWSTQASALRKASFIQK